MNKVTIGVIMKKKEIKITKTLLYKWKKDSTILLVVKCNKCGLLHEIKSRFYTYNCKCGQNLICWQVINYAGSKVLHRHKELTIDSLKQYF